MLPILRRLLYAAGLIAATALAFEMTAPLVRVELADLASAYEKAYSPSQMGGAMGIGHNLIRRETAFQPFGAFVDKTLKDRVITVEGPEWAAFFDGLAAVAGGSPPPEWKPRIGHDYVSGTVFFRPDEAPLAQVTPPLIANDTSFAYLRLPSDRGLRVAGLTVVGAADVTRLAPNWLAYPHRPRAPWLAAIGIFAYVFLPWPRKLAPDALRYGRIRSAIVPDIMAGVMIVAFVALPFLVISANSTTGRILDFSEDAWGYLTLVFWLMAAIFASIFGFSAWYESFQLIVEPMGLRRVTLFGERRIAFHDMLRVEYTEIRPPRWLRTLMFIAGTVNWRMMGQALLLESRLDWGITVFERGGRQTRIVASGMPDFERVIDALEHAKVRIVGLDIIRAWLNPDEDEAPAPTA